MTLDKERAIKILSSNGPLSRQIPGYEERKEQMAMLGNVVDAFNQNKIALIEAGTGIGKSMAYLIPALLWGAERKERTLVSTNTIALQEQLIHKDIPLAMKALGVTLKAVLVKGMRNYVCLRKLDDSRYEKLLLPDREAEELEQIDNWAGVTKDGTLSDLPFVPSYNTWEKVCAESDTCNRRECPFFKKCHFFRARKEAEDAQLIVANHSMLFADLAYRSENLEVKDQGLIPDYHRVIMDEAHNVEDTATEFFASRASHLQMIRTLNRLGGEKNGKLPFLLSKIREIKQLPEEIKPLFTRLNIDLAGIRREVHQKITDTFQIFEDFIAYLLPEDEGRPEQKIRLLPRHLLHPRWVQEVVPHTKLLIEEIRRYTQSIRSWEQDLLALRNSEIDEKTEGIRFEINALGNRLEEAALVLENFTGDDQPKDKVRWIEVQQLKTMKNLHLIDAELDIAPLLARSLFNPFPTTALCSATLTTNKTFEFTRQRLGLTDVLVPEKLITENIYLSPFDYHKQALLAIPTDMPYPKDPAYIDAVCERTWDAITASRGNAFILFTSYAMLRACYEKLLPRLQENRFPTFKQGDENRQTLLNKFRKTDYSVLFGTDSFWEGVDVAGEALRCVVIVKLPFKVPTEPIIQARTEAITEKGGDPFFDYSVPNAIVKFKQGFGRLIRNKKDRGCIVCLDSRLVSRGYGRLFLNSLPPCQQIQVVGEELKGQLKDFYKKTYHLVKG